MGVICRGENRILSFFTVLCQGQFGWLESIEGSFYATQATGRDPSLSSFTVVKRAGNKQHHYNYCQYVESARPRVPCN